MNTSTVLGQPDPRHRRRDWQSRGHCLSHTCGLKVAGSKRVRHCLCGSRVTYR
jgi:hypothetical protein